jgi:ankyrin repeat protein
VSKQTIGLHLAAYFGLREATMALLRNEHDPNVRDAYGRLATRNRHEAMVERLLATEGVDVNSKDTQLGRTPLSRAAEKGCEVIVKLLLAKDNIYLDSKDNNGRMPLSWAAEKGCEVIVKLLLAKDNIYLDSKDNNGRTPLSWAAQRAAEKGHETITHRLVKKGANVNAKYGYSGWTALHLAAENGHETVVKLLIKNGANAHAKDKDGWTALNWAAWYDYTAVVQLLDPLVPEVRIHYDDLLRPSE